MTAPLLVENVTKTFKQGDRTVTALAGVTLAVERARFLAIMGASGSGKSTLLHLMAGLTSPDAGDVLVEGQNISRLSDHDLTLFRRRKIGLVFQSFNLIPTLSAWENVALPLMLDGKATMNGKVDDLLTRLGLAHRREHRPDVMSGGEQQRVAIGRALITDPAVLLADEPTGNLDSANSKAVCQLLRDLAITQGKTIIMVTHEPTVAAYAQEVAIMKDGKLIDRFETSQTEGPQHLAARYQDAVR